MQVKYSERCFLLIVTLINLPKIFLKWYKSGYDHMYNVNTILICWDVNINLNVKLVYFTNKNRTELINITQFYVPFFYSNFKVKIC